MYRDRHRAWLKTKTEEEVSERKFNFDLFSAIDLHINFIGVIGGWSPQSVPFRGMFILLWIFLASSPNSDDGVRSLTTALKCGHPLIAMNVTASANNLHQIEISWVAGRFRTRITDIPLNVELLSDMHGSLWTNSKTRAGSSHQFHRIQR